MIEARGIAAVGARLLGWASQSHDLVDFYASRDHPEPYAYEERFARETSIAGVFAPTVRAVLAHANIASSQITQVAAHELLVGAWKEIAKATGIGAANAASDVATSLGELGVAHALFGFALACATARPGDHILLIGFGSGCDALIFRLEREMPGARTAVAHIKTGLLFDDYLRFLSLNGARVMMEFTDADNSGFSVGDRVRMRRRIKSRDKRRGFRTYFWKAALAERPSLRT